MHPTPSECRLLQWRLYGLRLQHSFSFYREGIGHADRRAHHGTGAAAQAVTVFTGHRPDGFADFDQNCQIRRIHNLPEALKKSDLTDVGGRCCNFAAAFVA